MRASESMNTEQLAAYKAQQAEIERLRAALTEYIECYGRPRKDEWVDGGPSYDRATAAWHEARALLGKSPAETGHDDGLDPGDRSGAFRND